ncbi:MAG: hypothetical protein DMF64_20190 [Acidobacteria bacterium]|nr:MAG: hypothetical protein DMF64_20190 [Acidobacteriota bacterium]
MALLALYPQLSLWHQRGADYQGEFVSFSGGDEEAYAAYVNALVAGRPRRNDPFTGRDAELATTRTESLFSIQFVPAYAVALPARLFGLSTATMFILLAPLAAFASALALFWLIALVTKDDRVAAACVPVVLCLGALATAQGAARTLLHLPAPIYVYLPFLRRYEPAVSFPLFFLFCALVWRVLTHTRRRAVWWSIAFAALVFWLLVFSYFYLWTAAAAWLACLTLLWLAARPDDWRTGLWRLLGTGLLAALALLPYLLLLARRATTTDAVQGLARSHAPDLTRRPELFGFVILLALALAAWRGRIAWREPATLCAASFALVPFAVFNQQIVTGRSLQPMHYEQFIANYAALTAACLAATLIWRGPHSTSVRTQTRALVLVALLAFGVGLMETLVETKRYLPTNLKRDEERRVLLRLDGLTRTISSPQVAEYPVVLCPDPFQADDVPMVAARARVLWAPHMSSFPGLQPGEYRERLFRQLYYTGVDPQRFAARAASERAFLYQLFGWARANRRLNVNWQPITAAEIQAQVRAYTDFYTTFDRTRAAPPELSYVITPAAGAPELSNLDRWYERDAGERMGAFMLYSVRLRP